MKLLLERGADPNVSSIPMPVIFLAIKAGHVEAVQRLLERGAHTDLHLTAEVRLHFQQQSLSHEDLKHLLIKKNVLYLDQLDQLDACWS